jgi:ribosome-binding protein aMBF1 (putative translation factor)
MGKREAASEFTLRSPLFSSARYSGSVKWRKSPELVPTRFPDLKKARAVVARKCVHLSFVGNCPLAYHRQKRTINLEMAKRRKQVQPLSGVEKAFGEAMRTIRQEREISQMALHARTGLDRTFISDLERGIQCPSLRTIFRVATGLEITPCTLLRRTEESPHFVPPSERDSG